MLNLGPIYKLDGSTIQDIEAERNRQNNQYGTKPMSLDETLGAVRKQLSQMSQAEVIGDWHEARRQAIQVVAIAVNHLEGL